MKSAHNLLLSTILSKKKEYRRKLNKGLMLNFNYCDNCHEEIEEDQKIFAFFCKHKRHVKCEGMKEMEEIRCPKCSNISANETFQRSNTMMTMRITKMNDEESARNRILDKKLRLLKEIDDWESRKFTIV
jgi:hypothetical protein